MATLVTGGAGFIGSHLLDRLAETTDQELVCLDNFNDYYDPQRKRANIQPLVSAGRVTLAEGDICDEKFCENLFKRHAFEAVVHLAARAGVRASVQQARLYERVNCQGTLVLLDLAHAHGVKRFVQASSSTIYGRRASIPFREDDPGQVPSSPYGVTKLACELFCSNYASLFGMSIMCLRFFSVYGPRQRPDMGLYIFAEAISQGRELPLFGDGTAQRDMTYCADIIDGVVAALSVACDFEVVNLGNNRPIEVRRIIELLEQELGKQANIRHLPEQAADVPLTCAGIDKAARLLGYQPKVPLADGIPRFVQWYRQCCEGYSDRE